MVKCIVQEMLFLKINCKQPGMENAPRRRKGLQPNVGLLQTATLFACLNPFEIAPPIWNKVTRGNSGRGVNSGRRLLFSGEEGLHFQTWYAG